MVFLQSAEVYVSCSPLRVSRVYVRTHFALWTYPFQDRQVCGAWEGAWLRGWLLSFIVSTSN